MREFYNKHVPLFFAVILIGISSVTTQTIFLRELLTVFYGNELIYGIVLAIWLFTYALGAVILGGFTDRIKNLRVTFALTQFLALILFPLLVFLIRSIRTLLSIPLGVLVDLPTTVFISLLSLLPLTVLFGFQFSLGSKLLKVELGRKGEEIGLVYMFEAVGAVIGGTILSFLLLSFLNSFQIVALLSILLAVSGLILVRNYKLVWILFLTVFCLIVSSSLEYLSNRIYWKGFELIRTADSPYGRLAVTKCENEFNFFANGLLLFSTADKAGAEELVHLSFLMHKDPKNILLVEGGLGGVLNEIVKYSVERIDCLELDPKVVELAKEIIPKEIPSQVEVYVSDGISFLSKTKNKYDLIIINCPEPQTALLNRFYTYEFFTQCFKKLNEFGILVFKLPVSPAYMGLEMRSLNSVVLKTVTMVFKNVEIVPGSYNYFFASNRKFNLERTFLLEKWKRRKIPTEYFNFSALSYDLLPERINYLWQAIRFDEKTKVNTELQPLSYFQALLLWASYFHSSLKYWFYRLMQIKFYYVLGFFLLVFLFVRILSLRYKTIRFPSLIGFLGFAGMTIQVIIVLTFQAKFGYLYQMIGFLTAAFMGGLAGGSFWVNLNYEKIKLEKRLVKTLLVVFLIYFLIFILLLRLKMTDYFWLFLFSFSSLLTGVIVGAIFPIIAKMQREFQKGIGGLAGILYGADLLGSSLAAISVGIYFVPVYGILKTILIAVFSVFCALALLW